MGIRGEPNNRLSSAHLVWKGVQTIVASILASAVPGSSMPQEHTRSSHRRLLQPQFIPCANEGVQVVDELKRTNYRPKMAILVSEAKA